MTELPALSKRIIIAGILIIFRAFSCYRRRATSRWRRSEVTVDATSDPKPNAADIGTTGIHYSLLEPKSGIATVPTSSIADVSSITATVITVALTCSWSRRRDTFRQSHRTLWIDRRGSRHGSRVHGHLADPQRRCHAKHLRPACSMYLLCLLLFYFPAFSECVRTREPPVSLVMVSYHQQ
jgi:hypothetical protein